MQENEFEKQLKKMMDEFQLSPSASVWDKVNRRINEPKRRKRPFIFLLFAALITAGYFMYHISEKHEQILNNYTNNKINNGVTADSISLQDSDKLYVQKTFDDKNVHDSSANNKTTLLKDEKRIFDKRPNSIKAATNGIVNNKNLSLNKTSLIASQNNSSNYHQQINAQSSKQNNINAFHNNQPDDSNLIFPKQSTIIDDSAKSIEQEVVKDNTFVNTDSAIIVQSRSDVTVNNTTKKSSSIYKTPNWQFGIAAFYGRSNIVEGLSSVKSLPAQYLNNPGNPDTVFNNKHSYSSSDSYQFGVVIQKKILRHSFITAGINFVHLSAKSDVGNIVNSAITISNFNGSANYFINGYAQPGSLKTFINKYNFIELPVYFQQDFLRKKNISFSYNAGISVRQLISSDALIYDQYNNIYFSKDDLLRKTQFQFLAGLNFKINAGKNSSFFLGPQFTYSLSDLIKNSSSNNFHFINYGLQAGFLLHKK